jgi:hypothetical protein
MRTQKSRLLLASAAAAAGLFAAVVPGGAASADQNDRAVQQLLDYYVESDNPQALCNTFTQTFQLPAFLPYTTLPPTFDAGAPGGPQGGISLCIVYTGRAFLEVYKWTTTPPTDYIGHDPQPLPPGTARFQGQLFTTPGTLQPALDILNARGVVNDGLDYAVLPGVSEPAEDYTYPQAVEGSTSITFLSYFHPWFVSQSPDMVALNNSEDQQLQANGGGPLGVVKTQKVIMKAADQQASLNNWSAMLAPYTADSSGTFTFPDGPQLQIQPGMSNPQYPTDSAVAKVVIKVANLDAATSFLQANGMLGQQNGNGVTIDPSAIQGLNIELTSGQNGQ